MLNKTIAVYFLFVANILVFVSCAQEEAPKKLLSTNVNMRL